MGTLFRIQVHAIDEASVEPAVQAAWKRVHELDAVLSDYDPDSELMRFCRQPAGTRVALSEDLHAILNRSQALSLSSGGAFDVTIGPLKRLWRQARRDGILPDADRLAGARALTGFRQLQVFADGTASLARDGMRLDLGGIAKGYAADAVLAILRDHGFPQALVAASGDIVVGDPPPGEAGWTVGVASLASPDEADEVLTLRHQALSTSGDTVQFVEIDGTRYSHIVDPRTGLGLTTRRSASVVAPTSVEADSLATTFCLRGGDVSQCPPGTGFRVVGSIDPEEGFTVDTWNWPPPPLGFEK